LLGRILTHRIGHLLQGEEEEIELWMMLNRQRRSHRPTVRQPLAVNPGIGQTMGPSRDVVVQQRLRRVQYDLPVSPEVAVQMIDEIVEIACCRFVGTDVLGGVHRVELDAEFAR